MSSTAAAKKIWTILDLITWGTEYLSEKKIDEARLTIELLLAHVLHLQRIHLYTNFDKPLSDEELAAFKELLKRRLTHEPLHYILGETEFMGLKFSVDKRVLIPRPETELLVEQSVKFLRERFSDESTISILDIGTGSGCIAVSLAKMLPNAEVIALDVSADALEMAKHNAQQNGIDGRIEFVLLNILEANANSFQQKFHAVISNPPYISKREFAEVSNNVKDFEPHVALTDERDGTSFFPVIARLAREVLHPNGIVGVEHAYDQSETVQTIFRDYDLTISLIVNDYQKIPRHLFGENK